MTNERREEETETIEMIERMDRDLGRRSNRGNFALKFTVFTRTY